MSDNTVKVIAHRGFHWDGAEENSLDAIKRSNEVADGAEFDVRLTADGVMVLSHDPTTVYGTNISSTGFDELYEEYESTGGHLTTFAEALAAIDPDKWIFAEVKVAGTARRIYEEVPESRRERLRIGSYYPIQTVQVPSAHGADIPADISGFDCIIAKGDAYPLGLLPPKDLGAWGVTNVAQAERLVKIGAQYLIVDDPVSVTHLRGGRTGFPQVDYSQRAE
jgi:glycerophosphoryl diester phosphodiesterase